MTRRVLTRIGLAALIALAAVTTTLLARGGELREERATAAAADPHPLVPRAQRNRILHAAAAITNAVPNVQLVDEGRDMFRSTTLGKPGESCQSCHTDGGGNGKLGTVMHSTDPASGLPGGFDGPRDAPSLLDVTKTLPLGWTGQDATVEDFVIGALHTHFADEQALPKRVAAISAYVKTIKAPISSFDLGTMSPAAQRGQLVFDGQGACSECHGGLQFTDRLIHPTGVPVVRFGVDNDPGPFDTPQLRDLKDTAPYMHNGVFNTLEEVVEFYDHQSSLPVLGLTAEQKADLVAFMKAL
jgi:cytochrome c peroxidase